MDSPRHRLEEELERAKHLLMEIPSWAFEDGELVELSEAIERLRNDLQNLSEQVFIIGLLGGTGVGKSTIMNALAGKEISSTSHRRPHTDKVIIYHHMRTPLPKGFQLNGVPFAVFPHTADYIDKLVLCDLPDFDSIEEEHRACVLSFLEQLDVLVWVVSPEKYADQALYEFLASAVRVKSPDNYFFVFNKADTITEGGYDAINKIKESFEKYLISHGVTHPLIFVVSALEASSGSTISSWNQWEIFKREIFRERELKEIREIKKANLHQEFAQILKIIDARRMKVKTVAGAMDDVLSTVESLCGEYKEKCGMRFRYWVSKCLFPKVQLAMEEHPDLVGPGRLIYIIVSSFNKKNVQDSQKKCEENGVDIFSPIFMGIEDHLTTIAIAKGLPPSVRSILEGLWKKENLSQMFITILTPWADILNVDRNVGRGAFMFRSFQWLVYGGLVVIFVGSMGEVWLADRSDFWVWILSILFTCTSKMFSLDGLGALLVLLIMECLAGIYFFSRYRKFLQRKVQKFIDSFEANAETICGEFFRTLVKSIREKCREIAPKEI